MYPSAGYTLTHQLFLAFIWSNGPCRAKLDQTLQAQGASRRMFYKRYTVLHPSRMTTCFSLSTSEFISFPLDVAGYAA